MNACWRLLNLIFVEFKGGKGFLLLLVKENLLVKSGLRGYVK